MTRFFPLPPIYLAVLSALLYFSLVYRQLPILIFLAVTLAALFCQYSKKIIGQVLVYLTALTIFLTGHFQQMEQAYQTAPETIRTIQLIPDTISINGDRLSFQGRSAGRRYQVFYRLASEQERDYFANLDQVVSLQGEIRLIEAAEQGNFSGFNYREYLKNQGIYRLAQLERLQAIEPVQSLSFLDYLAQWRRQAILQAKTRFPAPMSHYMTGLLFGYLDKDFADMSDRYADLGIIHLFALSGMQVGFFLTHFRKIFLRLGLRQDVVDGMQVPFSLFYAGLTGFSISVIRSLIQAFLGRYGIKGVNNFAVTFLICLFILPNFLLTVGGVLSFAYAFVISMMDFSHLSGYRQKLAEGLTLTLGILPLLLAYFSVFQPWSVVLTTLFSLCFDYLFLPLLSVAFLLSPILALTFFNPLFIFVENLVKGTGGLLSKPLILGQATGLMLVLLLLCLTVLYDYYQNKKVLVSLVACLALLFTLVKHPLTNEVTMLDVGQGDSLLLRDMRGKTILLDIGGRLEIGQKEAWRQGVTASNAQRSLIPYLKSRGIGRINQLVISHAHADHMGDLEVLVKEIRVDEILVSQGALTKTSFVNRLQALNIKVRTVRAGDSLSIMGSRLQVLSPLGVGDGGNDDSLVLYGRLLGLNFLFTGDLEAKGEEDLLASYSNLPVDVLKVGHHGSRGSSSAAFLERIQPKLALISVGQNNRYQHPHQEALARLQKQGIRIYRTDQDGAIRFSGQRTWQLETVR
ncbi:DNA internalization-related competence protein ComEC/Rec2 [Streptococcus cuniculipharyngis]|uniref:DNA internalization-related competence protein ComEC/Rec2 n=1 Tax=Streptococcus cuniculipharyngis TaxID=1562651 RepID=A0A5C5SEY6_9STRE|nr:DNA internalization-related competence protein ComEC/Rec2 [Streptococcus cuniculipharyngis]TWS98668.1 DNA internalization-related competence protein ComEC/Rec2 [Streptococcus cuniculipharyngis]